ncbi:hypothetical protein ACIRS1_34630 [Kitasatospora sp. NPDC101176]|uniref:hypothetical protein n=1 Tax=Kitasatospora sp. NPDC101176 TaxID=3364099 RepID=UPI0038134644
MTIRLKPAAVLAAVAATTALGTLAAPANAASPVKAAAGHHSYNPQAPLGSIDNPVIIGGNQELAVLTPAQRAATDQAKIVLAAEAKSREEGTRLNVSPQPATDHNCVVGVYWSQCDSAGWGWWTLATTLDKNHHEWATQQGYSPNHNFDTYMDRSYDGGSTWDGILSTVVNTAAWGDSIYDGPGNWVRACIYNMDDHLVACDAWH